MNPLFDSTKVDITHLQSYMELLKEDQEICYEKFISEPLKDKHIVNKYLKHTDAIEDRARVKPVDNECFLTYDMYPVNYKYSAVVFSICGVTHQFYYVLYMSVVEEMKMPQPENYLSELMANILMVEIPKLKSYSLKFVLCRDNKLNDRVLQLLFDSPKMSVYFNAFPFIREPSKLRHGQLHNPYSLQAYTYFMQAELTRNSAKHIFETYNNVATSKHNTLLKVFLEDYYQLALKLLESREHLSLRLCSMERMETFERIVRAHMKSYNDRAVSRLFIFDLIRALIHIYNC